MKKLIAVFIAFILVLSFTVFAEGEITNYAKDAVWGEGVAISKTETNDGITTAYQASWDAWSSPTIDLLPAIKAALGTEDFLEATITFEIKGTFKEGNAGEVISAYGLFRGTNGLTDVKGGDDNWNDAYVETLDGEEAIFKSSQGNIMWIMFAKVEITDEDWTLIEIPLSLVNTQINSPALKEWNLCIDTISNPNIIETLQFKNLQVVLTEEYAPEPELTPEPETPEETPTPTPPIVFQTPIQVEDEPTATAEVTPAADESQGNEADNTPIIIGAVVGAVVILGAVVAIIIIKKKKQ